MTKNILTFSNIQIGDILYYDPAHLERCNSFCAARDIDCLPSLENPNKLFVRDPQKQFFKEKFVSADRLVEEDMDIFSRDVLKRFKVNPLLFVTHKGELSGVVHFSDYNNLAVTIHLYEQFLGYEKKLRSILVNAKYTNHDMLDYFDRKATQSKKEKDRNNYVEKKASYERNRGKIEKKQEFESFYLADLIALTNHKLKLNLKDLSQLRNAVMHVNDFVNMHDPKTDNFIYDIKTFETFWERVQQLRHDHKFVSNYLALSPTTS
jgi:hypothetical protein